MSNHIVVGLGFGDEGKGISTDWLVSQEKAPLVVRYSGGQQCGHTVVIGDKRHIHANFGSGTLRGAPSYFTEYCSFYMNTLVKEFNEFKSKGRTADLYIHPLAIMTTPYDVAYGRVRERSVNHGSCGLGIGSTMMRHNHTHKLFAVDLTYPEILKQKLSRIRNFWINQVNWPEFGKYFTDAIEEEMPIFTENCKNYEKYLTLHNESILYSFNNLIFEGSQGILLDKDHGIFPNVTYANTTSKNAMAICNKLEIKKPKLWYVTRCYQTRHGNGWMSNEDPITLVNNENEACVTNEWQGKFRTGEIDYELLKYAIDVDLSYRGASDFNLMITCNDQRPDFKFNSDFMKGLGNVYHSYSPDSKDIK